jgi:hypothetical protein
VLVLRDELKPHEAAETIPLSDTIPLKKAA